MSVNIPAPVNSVNGETGDVIIEGADVLPDQTSHSGKFLTTDGASLSWGSPAGSGDVIGPATNTDSYIPQWDGANSKTLKNGIPTSTFAPALGADDNYVTNAQLSILGNTSGTNTGDNATNTQYSGLATSKANIALDNLASVAINTSLISDTDSTDDLGSSSKYWANLYTDKIYLNSTASLDGASAGTLGITGNIQLPEASIKLDSVLSTDERWSGITTSGVLGATLAVGDLVYLNADDGRWELVDANKTDGYDKQLGIVLLAGNDGDTSEILVYGKVRSAAFPAFTVGSPLYISETAGDLTHTAPTTADVAIRICGFALTAEDMLFNPSNDYTVHV